MNDYKAKLQYHIDRAEQAQLIVASLEEAALRKAEVETDIQRTRADGSKLPADYAASKILENNFPYKSACSTRNAHQAMVQMYLAAILGGLDR